MQRLFALHKMNFLEYTALCILKKLVSEETLIIPVSMEKYIENPALLGDLRTLINDYEQEDKTTIVILNSYTTSPMEKLLDSLDSNINKMLLLPEQSEKRGISNISLIKYSDNNYLDMLLDGLREMDNLELSDNNLEKLRILTNNFGSTNSTNLVASDLLELKDLYSDEEDSKVRIELLKSSCNFPKNITQDIGIQLSLIINYKKLDSYYNWMCKRLTRQLKAKDFRTNFFTSNEIDTMYSSLDARISNLNDACADCEIQEVTRTQEQGEIVDYVYYIKTMNASKALNTVYLMLFSKENQCSVISCADKFSIVSKFDGEEKIVENIKHKMLRYVIPMSEVNKVV